jgi:hypothetical protein
VEQIVEEPEVAALIASAGDPTVEIVRRRSAKLKDPAQVN